MTLTMNLRLLLLALTASLPLLSTAQVGNGVVFYSEANLAFTPTTVDSTTILTVELGNEVGVAQTVSLSGLDGPFSLLGPSDITIGSEASSTLNLAFAPTSLGDFTDTLHAQGAVFGEADIVLSGEGIQVLLEWSADTLYFDTTAIGATSFQDLVITNVGNGTAAITDIIIDNDAFSVEFLDPYVPPTPQAPCYTIPANDYGGDFDVPYREFYLTIEGGAFPDNLYWNIYDPWGAYNYSQYGPVTDYPICLPDNWNLPTNPDDYCCYNYFEFNTQHELYNPVFTDGIVFTIRDEWNNEVWSFDLGDWPDWNYSSSAHVTTGNPPAGPDFTPGFIGEGLSTIARVSMTPSNSGSVEGTMTFSNTSTNTSPFTASLTGAGISEISGDLCGSWTAEDSPYSFTGPVRIPSNCNLTIEPGATIIQDGFNLEILGEFSAEGTSEEPISISGGDLYLASHQDTAQISFLNRGQNEFSETIYLNTFENVEMTSQFNCFDETYGNVYTGSNTNGNGNYGCDDFDYNSGNLQFYSNGGHNAYIYTNDTLFAPSSGEYEISAEVVFYSYQYNGTNKYFLLELFVDNTWTAYDSIQAFQGSEPTHFLRAKSVYQAGDPILYRFRHKNDYSDGMDSRIDNVRVGSTRRKVQITPWDIAEQQDSLTSLIDDYGYSSYFQILDSGILDIQTGYYEWGYSSSEDWETTTLITPPIQVESSGQYYCSVFSNTTNPERENDWYLQFRINASGSWHTVASYTNHNSSYGITPGWIESVAKLPVFLNPGDRIDFRVDPYINSSSSSYNEIDFQLKDISFFKLASGDILERPVKIKQSNFNSLATSSFLALDSVSVASVEMFDDQARLDGQLCNFESIEGVAGNAIDLTECKVSASLGDGIFLLGDNTQVKLYGCEVSNHSGSGISLMGANTSTEASYSFVANNGGSGIYNQADNWDDAPSEMAIDNCLIGFNGGYGLRTDGAIDVNYSTIIHNESSGCLTSEFSTVTNSILWFNGSQLASNGGVYAASYSNVQGINALLTDGAYAWGDGCIGTDPVLADSLGHLDPFSPCVDGGMPWEQDAHIPYGLGSSRADMGMYGGPANAYWGGQAPPDGAVVITDIFDIPQDQGGKLGMHFTASPFDFGGLGFNVTHYSVWRDLSLGSDVPTIAGDGNWEQIGMVPAQGFGQYGYTAETLVDATPGDTTCLSSFIVIAHTTDDNIYWVSDVAAACSYDNLAPLAPELDGDVLLEEPDAPVVVVSWPAPEEEDYAYTVIERADGVSTNVVGDTLLLDADVEVGLTYDYLGYHLDLNGNPSDTAYVSVTVGAERDIIPLHAGWNLVSLDRSPVDVEVASVMAELMPGNLLYVTGFDAGVTFFDPNGLPFLNTLSTLEDGYGYWVKVAADDTLRVEGESLPAGMMPQLDAGWNLVAYTAQGAATPSAVFADLLAADELEYVTGFDGGVQFFDPAGLPFLNSLNVMQNGFGYWVKTVADFAGMVPAEDTKATPNPNYIVLNGTSNLGAHAGQNIAVVTADGTQVAEMAILEGGHLMTTPVYGAGPSGSEGIELGQPLYLEFAGERSDAVAMWTGDMAHVKLDVQFDGPVFSVFPNPATNWIDVRFELTESGNAAFDVLDAAGRLVISQPLGVLLEGKQQAGVSTTDLVPGAYQVRLTVDGRSLHTTTLHRIR